MRMKQLTEFDLKELQCIMNALGRNSRIFNSEAQFQFELAWKIKEEFDCEVKLEELSRIYKGKKSKKDYTDIILEKDGLRIALELKYKTDLYEDKSNNIYLKAHGAADLGAYDFLWDVHRIQLLTGIEKKLDSDDVKMPCDRGYAIILTNDSHYWNSNSNNTLTTHGINRDFLIGSISKGNTFLKKGSHNWYTTQGTIGLSQALKNDKSRQNSIKIVKDYPYKWQDYYTIAGKNGKFKYMVVEIS